jgi:uncharacterized alpha-E superfamily protein
VLARDADATYWMSRYIERAEHVARMLLVNSEALIDVGDLDDSFVLEHWLSVLGIMNIDAVLPADDSLPQQVAELMTFDDENPNSLVRCLTRARENARGIREVISSEMWEQLNTLYWSIIADDARTLFRESPDQFYRQIISGSMLFQGLTDQTLIHGQRWYFAQLGKHFERITVTCRTLRAKYEILRNAKGESAHETSLVNIHWMTILRSCGSVDAYRRTYLGELDPLRVVQFVILEPDFPRSVQHCVREAHEAIAAIRAIVRPRSVDPTERILGRLDSQLEYAEGPDLFANDLTNYLNQILDNIAEAALAVQRSFFLH